MSENKLAVGTKGTAKIHGKSREVEVMQVPTGDGKGAVLVATTETATKDKPYVSTFVPVDDFKAS